MSGYSRNISIELHELLEIMTNQEAGSSSNGLRYEDEGLDQKLEIKENVSIHDLLLPELALPIGISRDSTKKGSIT